MINKDRMEWWQDGFLHRDYDLPAVIAKDGTQEWYQHGKLHRGGDKPAVVQRDGNYLAWYTHDNPHRGGGKPAVMVDGVGVAWYKDGTLLREVKVAK